MSTAPVSPGVQADVGIQDGRVVAVGEVAEAASRTIDADGLVVAPGFVDIHTHYDAQIKWDPGLAPSVLHGVTTVVGGNTGFTIAPIRDEHADYMRRLLSRVEGMPLSALEVGVDWGTWSSYGEYLDELEGRLTVNAGFLAGHSAIRRVAMGEQAVGQPPTEDQMQVMERLLDESLAAGALGFSSSNGRAHTDGYGDPVPSRWASEDELLRLCRVVREHEGSVLEYIPSSPPEEADRLTAMSLTADRPLNWNVLTVAAGRIDTVRAQMAVSDHAAARGATVRCLTVPMVVALRYSFVTGFGLEIMPNWGPVFKLPIAERLVALADPAVRDRMRAGAAEARKDPRNAELSDYGAFLVEVTSSPQNQDALGRRIDQVAAERGVDPLDALCDIVIEDDLQTVLRPRASGDDDESWALRPDIWRDPRVVLGGSDAGAHLDMMTSFSYFTTMLGESVREHQRDADRRGRAPVGRRAVSPVRPEGPGTDRRGVVRRPGGARSRHRRDRAGTDAPRPAGRSAETVRRRRRHRARRRQRGRGGHPRPVHRGPRGHRAALGPGHRDGAHRVELARRPNTQGDYWMWTPEIARAITSRWISEVPSKIV